jgi:hypothetical protein
MTNARIRKVVLLVLSSLWVAPSHAADPGTSKFSEERAKQQKIYRSNEQQVAAGYTVDRSLEVYAQGLSSEFGRTLADLGPTHRWLDIGAGEGLAILDYLSPSYDPRRVESKDRRGRKAQAVAMSIEDRRTPRWQETAARLGPDQMRYLADRPLREYSVEELGKFQIITDVIGGFSYTETLSPFMEKVMSLLEVNGSFFTVLQDVHRDEGTNRPFYPGARFLTEITNTDGSELKVCAWLKRITCAEVTCQSRAQWKPPLEAFHVRKVCDDVTVPSLTTVHYEAGTPPERRFQLKN